MKKAIILIVILAALFAGGYYCYEEGLIDRWFPGFLEKVIPGYESKEPSGRVSSDAENAVFLDSVSILCGLGSGSGEILRFSGEVEPQETVSYDLDGNRTVGECFVKEGDHVSDGQELFIYDTTEEEQDLAQAEIDLERLQNSHDTSEAEIVELTRQYEKEQTPENELELLTAKNDLKQNALDQEAKQKEIDRLKKEGLYEDTVIIYVSDHGSHFGTRNRDAHLNGSDDCKRTCHDSALRVPLVIRGGPFAGGRTEKRLVSTESLPRTILSLAGMDAGGTMIGEDLCALISSHDPGRPNEVYAQISESRVGRCVRTPDFLYSVYAPGKNGWTEAASDAYADDFLYDLRKDPDELNNLIHDPSYEAIKRELRRKLTRRILETEGIEAEITD